MHHASKGVKRLDTVEKLGGKQVFALDLQPANMLNATIAQCPVFGGKLKSFDAKAVQDMAGVRYVLAVGDNAVAVVADKFYQAKTAMEKPRSLPGCATCRHSASATRT